MGWVGKEKAIPDGMEYTERTQTDMEEDAFSTPSGQS
jgi:hypothetical protein